MTLQLRYHCDNIRNKFSIFLVNKSSVWFMPKITKLVSTFVKVMQCRENSGLFSSGHGVHTIYIYIVNQNRTLRS